jgi:hypothetical protein
MLTSDWIDHCLSLSLSLAVTIAIGTDLLLYAIVLGTYLMNTWWYNKNELWMEVGILVGSRGSMRIGCHDLALSIDIAVATRRIRIAQQLCTSLHHDDLLHRQHSLHVDVENRHLATGQHAVERAQASAIEVGVVLRHFEELAVVVHGLHLGCRYEMVRNAIGLSWSRHSTCVRDAESKRCRKLVDQLANQSTLTCVASSKPVSMI